MEDGKNTPIHKVVVGCVTAVIWRNMVQVDNKYVPTLNVTIERRYRNSDGEWKQTSSLKPNDIPKARSALQKAYDWICMDYLELLKQQARQPAKQVSRQQATPIEGPDLDSVDAVMDMM